MMRLADGICHPEKTNNYIKVSNDEAVERLIESNTLIHDPTEIIIFKAFLKSNIYRKLFK